VLGVEGRERVDIARADLAEEIVVDLLLERGAAAGSDEPTSGKLDLTTVGREVRR
jgi:hypothetical protein